MDDAISEIHPGLLSSVAALLPQDPKPHTDREVWAKTEAERTTEVRKYRAVLLKYADQNMTKTLMAVSACLDFDYQIYKMLGEALGFTVSLEQFEKLLRFPFVREEVHEDPKKRRFRVVGVLPILLKHEQPPLYLQAQQWLSKWYYNES